MNLRFIIFGLPLVALAEPAPLPVNQKNLNQACVWSASRDSHIIENPDVAWVRAIDNNDRFDFADLDKAEKGLNAAIFNPELQQALIDKGYAEINSEDRVLSELAKHASQLVNYSTESMQAFNKRMDEVRALTQSERISSTMLETAFMIACNADFAFNEPGRSGIIQNCLAATQRAYKIGKNWEFKQPMAMGEDFVRVMTNPIFDQLLAKLALKVLAKARAPRISETFADDFYQDLYQEALALSYGSPVLAEDMTESLLAVYSARGANYDFAFDEAKRENLFTVVSLQILSAAMTVLDFRTFGLAKQYAYPRGYTTGCAFGRPYHFWMSYVLGRRLKEAGYDDLSTLSALHNLQTAYTMLFSGSNSFGKIDFPYVLEAKKNVVIDKLGSQAALRSMAPLPEGEASSLMIDSFNQQPVDEFQKVWSRIPVYAKVASEIMSTISPTSEEQARFWLNQVAPYETFDQVRQLSGAHLH